jgi:hypothetical protein
MSVRTYIVTAHALSGEPQTRHIWLVPATQEQDVFFILRTHLLKVGEVRSLEGHAFTIEQVDTVREIL